MKKVFLFLAVMGLMMACTTTRQSASKSEELFSIGDTSISAEEFQYVYNKNNVNKDSAFDRADVEEYLDLFVKFKLKVKEAKALELDKKASFKQELEGYRKQLAKPYLTESKVTDLLVKEAYERMKTEVKAAHILINVTPNAAPADSLAAYNKIDSIRRQIVEGNLTFANAAKQFSQDPSAKKNEGNLGYFSAFQMVYPFESASYSTAIGEVSKPFRTRFGYHIVNVNDKRPSRGKVKVAHIMIRSNDAMPVEVKNQHKEKIDALYKQLKAGEDWKKLCSQFSQDLSTSKKGGVLPWIGTGSVDPTFESAAFGLEEEGALSAPVLSPYGWHIIRLDDKKPLADYETVAPELKERIKKDSRSQQSKKVLLKRLKEENNFVPNELNIKSATARADSSLLQGKWEFDSTATHLNDVLFTINGLNHNVDSFYHFVKKRQKPRRGLTVEALMQRNFDDFVEKALTSYEESQLASKYVDYRMLLKEYHEGILLFELMDQKVWTKAIKDTVGLKAFYTANQQNYQWEERVEAIIFDAATEEVLQQVKRTQNGQYFALNTISIEKDQPLVGQANDNKNATYESWGIDKIVNKLVNDKEGTKVIVSGNSGNFQQAQSIKKYMIDRGVGEDKVEVTKEGTGNVSVTLWSKHAKGLEQRFNEEAPLNLQVSEGRFEKGDKNVLGKVVWKKGPSEIVPVDNRFFWVIVKNVLPKENKALGEIKGIVISDYQNQLESDWVSELKEKYPVKINKEAFENVVENLEK